MSHGERPVTFHLRPHLAQFAARLNGQPPVPFDDCRETITAFARNCLSRVPDEDRDALRQWASIRTPYTFLIDRKRAWRYGRHITLEGAMQFERLVDQLMIQLVRQHLASSRHTGAGRIERIEAFMRDYGMDPMHLDAEAINLRIYRLKKRIAQKNGYI